MVRSARFDLAPVELVVAEGRQRRSPSRCSRRWSVPSPSSPRFESSYPCISSPASTSRTFAAPTAVRTPFTTVATRAEPGLLPLDGFQLAVEVVRVQDRERDRVGRGGARWRRDRRGKQRRGDKQQDRPGTSHGGTSEDEGTRGRTWPALSADQHKGTDRTLAPWPLAGHGRTAAGFTPIGTIGSKPDRRGASTHRKVLGNGRLSPSPEP